MPSTSLPSAITGRPEPQRATQPLGMPATPSSISKPSAPQELRDVALGLELLKAELGEAVEAVDHALDQDAAVVDAGARLFLQPLEPRVGLGGYLGILPRRRRRRILSRLGRRHEGRRGRDESCRDECRRRSPGHEAHGGPPLSIRSDSSPVPLPADGRAAVRRRRSARGRHPPKISPVESRTLSRYRAAGIYGSAKTNRLLPRLGRSSGVRRMLSWELSDEPVLAATYCTPSTA